MEIIHDFCHEASDPHTHPPPIHNCTFFHIPYSKGTKKGLRQWFGPKTPVTVPISIIKIVTDSMPPHYTEAVYYCLLLTWTMTSLPSTNVTAKGKITCSVPLFNWRQKQFYEQQNMKKVSHRSAHLLGNHFPFLLLHLWQFLSSSSYCCVWRHVSSFGS